MQVSHVIKDGMGTIKAQGRFDFAAHDAFQAATAKLLDDATVRQIVMDLSQVDYLDSSALGMLMLLNERCDQKGKGQLTLSGAKGLTRRVLDVAKFDHLMKLV